MAKNNSVNISGLLSYPYEEGLLSYEEAGKCLIWGASFWFEAENFAQVDILQSFYPETESWQGKDVLTSMPASLYQTVLCVLPKQKEACFYRLATGLEHLDQGGLLMAVAANDAGGKRLEKWFEEFGLKPTSLSKSKCRIVWALKEDVKQDIITKYKAAGEPQTLILESKEFVTRAGIYGWDKIDKGSKLLTGFIPDDLYGTGADFGAGYGYLSDYVLVYNSKIKKLYVYEADHDALECAKKNLKQYSSVEIEYHWADLTQVLPKNMALDFIVMNPPFHDGKVVDNQIGQKFIKTAAQALKKNGVLYMVANAYLPYERALAESFFKVEKLAEEQGFKVYKCLK